MAPYSKNGLFFSGSATTDSAWGASTTVNGISPGVSVVGEIIGEEGKSGNANAGL